MSQVAHQTATDIWDTAIARYRSTLQPEEWDAVSCTSTADAVLAEINLLKQQHERRWTVRALGRLDPVCERMRSFSHVVDTFVQSNPTMSALIWGSLKFVIEVILRFQAVFVTIVGLLEELTLYLPRFRRLWNLFPKSPDLESCLVNVYCDIIEFYAEAITSFRAPSVKLLGKAVFTGHEHKLQKIVQRINKNTEQVQLEATTASFEMDKLRFETMERLLRDREEPARREVKFPCRHIPFPENRRFMGREDVLASIHSILAPSEEHSEQRAFVLHGLGGMGKSEIALKYCWQHSDQFPVVFWVTAETSEKAFTSFLSMAKALGFDRSELRGNQIGCRQIVVDWLNTTNTNWLLIFDNAPEEETDFLRGFWPSGKSGSILITTRYANFARRFGVSNSLALEPVDGQTGFKIISSILLSVTGEEYQKEIEQLCKTLGGLPLALSQMAGFMQESGCSIASFLEMYSDSENIDDIHASSMPGSTMAYNKTLSSVWDVSISSMKQQTPRALIFLDCLAFLDADGIPVSLFKSAPAEVELPDEFAFFPKLWALQRSIHDLQTRSLIRLNAEKQQVWIHRLLQASTLSKMGPSRRQLFFNGVLKLVSHCFPTRTELRQIESKDMNDVWSQCSLYLPHVLSLVRRYQEWKKELHPSFLLATLLDDCTWYLVDYGIYSTAISLFETARTISELDPDSNLLVRANLYNTYGTLFRNSSRSAEAAELFQAAINVTERAVELGIMEQDDSAASICYMHMACAVLQLNRLDESAKWHKKAVSIREASPQSRPLELAMVYLNYGWCLWQRGELDEASSTLEKALHLMQEQGETTGSGSYGRSNWVMWALGNVRMAQQREEDAFNLHTMAFKIQVEVWGDNHFQTGILCHKMGHHYYLQGKYPESIQSLKAAIAVYVSTPAAVENFSMRTKHLLGMVLEKHGQIQEAEDVRKDLSEMLGAADGVTVGLEDSIEAWDQSVPYWGR